MAKKDRSVIKTYFETGDVPTQAQFGDSFDSQVFWNDDVKTTTAGNSDNEVPTTKAVNDAIDAIGVPTLQDVTGQPDGATTTNQVEIVKGPDDGGFLIKGVDLLSKVYLYNSPDNAGQIVVNDEANTGTINLDGFNKKIQVSNGTNQIEIFGNKLKVDNTHDVNYPSSSGTLALTSDIPTSVVESVTGNIVDNTDPINPVASLTDSNFGAFINGLSSKSTPIDADSIDIVDSADSNVQKKVSLTNLWANWLKAKTDAIYNAKSMAAYTIWANNTNATANAAASIFKQIAKQTYSGTIVWTGTTAPSGTTSHSYSWSQVGNQVTFNLVLFYGTAGSALTQVACSLPSDMPSPVKPDGITGTSEMIGVLSAHMSTGSTLGAQPARAALRIDSSNSSNFQLQVAVASAGYKVVWITGNYLTN